MSTFTLRRAVPSDASRLAILAQETFFATYAELVPERDAVRAYTETELNAGAIERAIQQGGIFLWLHAGADEIGYASIAGDPPPAAIQLRPALHLERLYLRRSWQRRGAGRFFLEQMNTLAQKSGFCALWLRVFDGNKRSLEFHRAMGFRQVGTLAWHYRLNGKDYCDNDVLFERAVGKM